MDTGMRRVEWSGAQNWPSGVEDSKETKPETSRAFTRTNLEDSNKTRFAENYSSMLKETPDTSNSQSKPTPYYTYWDRAGEQASKSEQESRKEAFLPKPVDRRAWSVFNPSLLTKSDLVIQQVLNRLDVVEETLDRIESQIGGIEGIIDTDLDDVRDALDSQFLSYQGRIFKMGTF